MNIFEQLKNINTLPPIDDLNRMIANNPQVQTARNTRETADKLDEIQETLNSHSLKLEKLNKENSHLQIWIAICSVAGGLIGSIITKLLPF